MASTTLIVIGSDYVEQAKSVEYYDPEPDKWLELDLDLELGRRIKFQSVMLSGKLMIIGGFDTDYSSAVQSYDYNTDTLTTVAPMKYPRYGHRIAIVDGKLYAIGGYAGDYLSNVEIYDPTTNAWTEGKPMPTPRYDFGIAVSDGVIYAVGGLGDDFFSVVESYNPKTDTWKTCAMMNEKRSYPAVASIGSSVYAAGGHLYLTYLRTAEKYDPVTDKWTYIEKISLPRAACGFLTYTGNMLVAGGYLEGYDKTGLIESYSGSGNWTTRAALATPRAYFSILEVPWTSIKTVQKRNLLKKGKSH